MRHTVNRLASNDNGKTGLHHFVERFEQLAVNVKKASEEKTRKANRIFSKFLSPCKVPDLPTFQAKEEVFCPVTL